MAQNFRDDAANAASEMISDHSLPAIVSRSIAAVQAIRLLDCLAWRVTQGAPFQFARWLAALGTVVANWILSGSSQTAIAYVPVLAVVGLLLLPDARSIGIAGLRFERLNREMDQQRKDVDKRDRCTGQKHAHQAVGLAGRVLVDEDPEAIAAPDSER